MTSALCSICTMVLGITNVKPSSVCLLSFFKIHFVINVFYLFPPFPLKKKKLHHSFSFIFLSLSFCTCCFHFALGVYHLFLTPISSSPLIFFEQFFFFRQANINLEENLCRYSTHKAAGKRLFRISPRPHASLCPMASTRARKKVACTHAASPPPRWG